MCGMLKSGRKKVNRKGDGAVTVGKPNRYLLFCGSLHDTQPQTGKAVI